MWRASPASGSPSRSKCHSNSFRAKIGDRSGTVVDRRYALDTTPRDDQRWINRGVEARPRFSKIFDQYDIGAIEQQLTHSTAGERSPQLAWEQIGESAARYEEIPCSLHEKRREIDLRGEAMPGSRGLGAALPGGAPINGEFLFQSLPGQLGDAMDTHPGRVADNEIEAAGGGDI